MPEQTLPTITVPNDATVGKPNDAQTDAMPEPPVARLGPPVARPVPPVARPGQHVARPGHSDMMM